MRPSLDIAPAYFRSLFDDTDVSHKGILDEINYLYSSLERELTGQAKHITLWLMDGKDYIGQSQIRLVPSGRHPGIESHLYYEIRPLFRRLGYGSTLMKLTLVEANKVGLNKIIVACYANNYASRKIIELNGGKKLREVRVPDHPSSVLVYKISTDSNYVV